MEISWPRFGGMGDGWALVDEWAVELARRPKRGRAVCWTSFIGLLVSYETSDVLQLS